MFLRTLRRRATIYLWRSPNPMVTAVRWAAALACLVLPLSACLTARQGPVDKPPLKYVLPAEEDALTDQARDGGVITIPSPSPLPWQKVIPCARWEQEINGACYILMDREVMLPPCAPGFIQHQGRCFQAIRKAKPQPVSGE